MKPGPGDAILVLALRRLGDALLTTPLIHSLKAHYPDCAIDVLAFKGVEGMYEGNADIRSVITMPEKPSALAALKLVRLLWRRYALAISTQSGDRPTLFALVAGQRRIGFVERADSAKRFALHVPLVVNNDNHRVAEMLRLAEAAGAPPRGVLVCPSSAHVPDVPSGSYAVLHANPKFRYRRWPDEHWRALAAALVARGMQVAVTGGGDAEEKAYLDRIWPRPEPGIVRYDGKLRWPDLTALLRNAALYIGPDTSVTHLAAGAGVETIAIYGPASPHIIGPWPVGGLDEPWARRGRIQRRGNVQVVQNPLVCLPCERLGCENHLESRAECLDKLPVAQILTAVHSALMALSRAPMA